MKKIEDIELDKLKKPTLVDTGIPSWLQPYKQDKGPLHTEATLEKALTYIEAGYLVTQICALFDDMPQPQFLYRWFRSTPEMLARYMEAKRVGAEIRAEMAVAAADGTDTTGDMVMEDVQRSALKVKTYQWYASKMDPDRFGEKKQIDVNSNISLTTAINDGLERAENRRIIDVTPD